MLFGMLTVHAAAAGASRPVAKSSPSSTSLRVAAPLVEAGRLVAFRGRNGLQSRLRCCRNPVPAPWGMGQGWSGGNH
jgi:hypothetical protein